jgi:hypothetical protein
MHRRIVLGLTFGELIAYSKVAAPAVAETSTLHPEIQKAEVTTAADASANEPVPPPTQSMANKYPKTKVVHEVSVLHCDIIKNGFWLEHPNILT